MSRPYRPANGSEGDAFYDAWCADCQRDIHEDCEILARALAFNVDEPQYPKEWIRVRILAEDGLPMNCGKCTAFVPKGEPIRERCPRTRDMFEGPA